MAITDEEETTEQDKIWGDVSIDAVQSAVKEIESKLAKAKELAEEFGAKDSVGYGFSGISKLKEDINAVNSAGEDIRNTAVTALKNLKKGSPVAQFVIMHYNIARFVYKYLQTCIDNAEPKGSLPNIFDMNPIE